MADTIIECVTATIRFTALPPSIVEGYSVGEDDLCTVADVRRIGGAPAMLSDIKIHKAITDATLIVFADSENTDLTQDDIFAKMACVYMSMVLLETEEGVSEGSKTITEFKDGNFGVKYDIPKYSNTPKTNAEKYDFYIAKIMENPFAYELGDTESYQGQRYSWTDDEED